MEQKKCWVLYCYDADVELRFSTKELAEKAIDFYNLDEDECRLAEDDIFDDEELLNRIAEREKLKNA